MATKLYWEKDANPKALAGKRIVVLGYGSQGCAHALNLRDRAAATDVVLALGITLDSQKLILVALVISTSFERRSCGHFLF